MSPSLYGFVESRGAVTPEEVAREVLAVPNANGDARRLVEQLVEGDARFEWDESGLLRTVDLASLDLESAEYVVFDVETTGASTVSGGITEIGAVRVSGRRVVEQFSSLVNPGCPIAPFVVGLTGITDEMVADAPSAAEVLPHFEEFAGGAVLVGHNVRFDCAFVEAALGRTLPNPVLDTLRLARILVPGLRRYRLASLVEYFGVKQAPNHRALSDAAATAGVLLRLLGLLSSAGVQSVGEAIALRSGARRRVRPQKQHLAERLPHAPGVYYFLDKRGKVLYVGKAKDLRNRVRTYFGGGDGRRKVARLVEEVAEVHYRKTPSELDALILEAREIRRLRPRYNSAGLEEREKWYIKLDLRERYPIPQRVSFQESDEDTVLIGPYRSAGGVDACIEALGRVFPLRRCSGESERACFYGQIGRCAPCAGMGEEEYRREVVGGISALLRGRGGEEHLEKLRSERDRLAAQLEFEAAARLRDLISGIERVRMARAAIGSEGVCVVVAPSGEHSGHAEVFAFAGGRLAGYRSFGAEDLEELSKFARGLLDGGWEDDARSPDELRIVAGYLRRRSSPLEVVRIQDEGDLLAAVQRILKAAYGS